MGVAETIDQGDSVLLQDLARLGGRLAGDQQEWSAAHLLRVVDELPGGGGVRVAPDLDDDRCPLIGEPYDGVDPTIFHPGLGLDGQTGDATQDTERVRLEGTLIFTISRFFTVSVNIADCVKIGRADRDTP